MFKHTIRRLNIASASTTKPGLEFFLETNEDNEVILKGADTSGHEWEILFIRNNGTFSLCTSVYPDLGLEVDVYGKIKESPED